jgi:Protein of unknown function (DUF1176)
MPALRLFSSVLLGLLLTWPAAAAPSQLKVFSDWIVGCDNGLSCHATSLLDEGSGSGEAASLSITRDAAGMASPVAVIRTDGWRRELKGVVSQLSVDGRALELRFNHGGGRIIFANGGDRAAIDAIRQGQMLSLLDSDGKPLATISLKGLSAALLFMDEQQRRLGTTTALVRRGDASPQSIPAPPRAPIVSMPPPSAKRPVEINAAQRRDEQKVFGCRQVEARMLALPIRYHRLDAANTLALVPAPCGTGAYNAHEIAVIVSEDGRARPADMQFPMDEDVKHMVVNPRWDPQERLLISFAKSRGLGDCGTIQRWAWDGERFRLAAQLEMSTCRGSIDFIATWRSLVVPR